MSVDRLLKLQGKLAGASSRTKDKPEALLVSGRENIRYLTGFTGSAGILLVAKKQAFLLTDGRYTLQAEEEVKGAEVKISDKPWMLLTQLIKQLKLKRLGFEAQHTTVAFYNQLQGVLRNSARLIVAKDLVENLRLRKDAQELKLIERAIQIASDALISAKDIIRPGITEKELAFQLEFELKSKGSEKTPFDIIVASGERSAMPHGIASDKRLAEGEMVVIDFGASFGGYNSDLTRTFILGEPSAEQKKIYQVVAEAQAKGIETIKPGAKASQIDKITRQVIEDAGYGEYFSHSTGHGVGLEVHESPRISKDNETALEDGMVFTMEPGIYLPEVGGVRIEDMVRVSADGCQVLSAGVTKGV